MHIALLQNTGETALIFNVHMCLCAHFERYKNEANIDFILFTHVYMGTCVNGHIIIKMAKKGLAMRFLNV